MASNEAMFLKIQMNAKGIRAILPTLVCEWVLIILLFIDASLSYLVTKFAHYCQLPAPCLLCSRIDHVLDGEEPDFYWSLLCSNHRSEVSSLISCQLHDKLVDGYKMCEECLLSFTTKNKPNPEMHRFMAGKLGSEHGCGVQYQFGNRDFMSGSVNTRSCSCCDKPWRSRHGSQRLFPQKPLPRVSKPNLPFPSSPKSLKKTRDKPSVPSNLKIASDSEPTLPFLDKSELKNNVAVPCDSEIKGSLLDSFEQININDSTEVKPSLPNVLTRYGSGDQDQRLSSSDSTSMPSGLVSLPETPPSIGASPKKSENSTGVVEVKGSMSTKTEEEFIDTIDDSNNYRTPMTPNLQFEEIVEESFSDCLDNKSDFNEAKGETTIAGLKQQILKHKSRINELYKELEIERSASNIAADEAMAMIRRLQEEKSSLQMEAMQYLRMMEEEAEHDADDLERASDLLADKERDIQDLEAELEFYKLNYHEEQMVENMTMRSTSLSLSHARNNLVWIELCKKRNEPVLELSWLEFKDEKLYISQGLESLESKLQEAYLSNRRTSNGEASSSSSSDDDSPNKEVKSMTALENEILDLRKRLKMLEANQDFLERALISVQEGNKGMQVVLEIARQLQELLNIGIRIRSEPIS